MIEKTEIEQKAEELSVSVPSVQRDYAVGWFLLGLFTVSKLKNEFFLKGGNAFRKAYNKDSRYSIDIDLGIQRDLAEQELKEDLAQICDFVSKETDIEFRNELTTVKEKFGLLDVEDRWKVFEVKIPFQDFYSHADHLRINIRMDVTRLDKFILPLQQRQLLHPYSDSERFTGVQIQTLKLEELVANKLKCLLQREHAPDLFDFVSGMALSSADLDRSEVLRTFLQKTIFARNPGVVRGILRSTPMRYFQEHWKKGIVCAKSIFIDVDTAITRYQAALEELFNPYPEATWNELAFFPGTIRHSIIQAGRTRTLLKMEYDGVSRFIEPYSMKYKEARSGTAREYLYVYDRTGSKNNPGIKSFLPGKVGLVENTDHRFEIREGFEMELAKAGELLEDRFLYDPNKSIPTSSKRLGRSSNRSTYFRRSGTGFGIKYRFKCPVCGKKFTKQTMDSTLGRHKGTHTSFDCYGTWGEFLGTT